MLGDTHPFPGNDDSLDLSGALVDLMKKENEQHIFEKLCVKHTKGKNHLVDFGIAHQLLSGVVGVEAVAAKDLDAVGGGLVGDVTREALGNGGVEGVLLSHVSLLNWIVESTMLT